MVYTKDIKRLDFNTIEEYFQYIVDSAVNGQYQQVRDLTGKLSKKQKQQFINWLSFSVDKSTRLYDSIIIVLV